MSSRCGWLGALAIAALASTGAATEAHGKGIAGPREPLVALSPGGPTRVSYVAGGHAEVHFRLYAVTVDDFPAFLALLRHQSIAPAEVPGKLVRAWSVSIPESERALASLPVDVTPALRNGRGHVLVVGEEPPPRSRAVATWVQVTDLRAVAVPAADELHVWAFSSVRARPAPAVQVTWRPVGHRARTDPSGEARMRLHARTTSPQWLVARRGPEAFIVTDDLGRGRSLWQPPPGRKLLWFVTSPGPPPAAGEVAEVLGWVRVERGGDQLPAESVTGIRYVLRDRTGLLLCEGRARVEADGGFEFRCLLPPEALPGELPLDLQAETPEEIDRRWQGSLGLLEYRPAPLLSELVPSAPAGVSGDEIAIGVHLRRSDGSPLAHLPFTWSSLTGPENLFWMLPLRTGGTGPTDLHRDGGEGETDCAGKELVTLRLPVVTRPSVEHVSFDFGVHAGDTRRASTRLVVMPAAVIPAFATRGPLRPGEPMVLDVAAIRFDGALVPGRVVSATLAPVGAPTADPSPRFEAVSGAEPAPCVLAASPAGRYDLELSATDDRGRPSTSRFPLEIAAPIPSAARELQLRVERMGGELRVELESAFSPALVLVIVGARPGREVTGSWIRMEDRRHEIRVPVSQGWRIAEVSAMAVEEGGPRQAWAHGSAPLAPEADPRLTVELESPSQVQAREPFEVQALVKDVAAVPVEGARVLLLVSEHGSMKDPSLEFRGHMPSWSRLEVSAPPDVSGALAAAVHEGTVALSLNRRDSIAHGLDEAADLPAPPPTPEPLPASHDTGLLRFVSESPPGEASRPGRPLRLLDASLRTDSSGIVRKRVTLPDDGTTYRLTAIALAPLRSSYGVGARVTTLDAAQRGVPVPCPDGVGPPPAAGGCASCGASASMAASLVPLGLLLRRRRRAS